MPQPEKPVTDPRKPLAPWNTLTTLAKVLLSDEDVERYIDLACADEGVRPWTDNVPAPPAPTDVQRTRVWVVGGHMLTSQRDAERLSALLRSLPLLELKYANGRWNGPQVVRPKEDAENAYWPRPEMHMTDRDYAAQQYAAQRDASARERYEAERRAFTACIEARAAVAERIKGEIDAARTEIRRKQRLVETYQHHLDLCDGATAPARRYLLLAYPEAEAVAPELFDDAQPAPPARALRLRDVLVEASEAPEAAGFDPEPDTDIPF